VNVLTHGGLQRSDVSLLRVQGAMNMFSALNVVRALSLSLSRALSLAQDLAALGALRDTTLVSLFPALSLTHRHTHTHSLSLSLSLSLRALRAVLLRVLDARHQSPREIDPLCECVSV